LSRFDKEKHTTTADNEDVDVSELENIEDELVGSKDDGDELDLAVQACDESLVEEVIKELDGEEVENHENGFGECRKLTPEELILGRCSLSKVTNSFYVDMLLAYLALQLKNLAKRIFNSPTLHEDLQICCERSKITPKLMIRAVVTRWNTTAEVIGCALQLREALSLLVNLEQHNKGTCGVHLSRFKLSKQEWEVLSQLYPLLEVRFLLMSSILFLPWTRSFSKQQKKFHRAKYLSSMKLCRSSILSPTSSMIL